MSAGELAEELGVSQRSIYRDVETLRAMGAPIDGQAGVGYRLGPGFFLPDLAFAAEELDALVLGLSWVRQRADPALARATDSALAKIVAARSTAARSGEAAPVALAPGAAAGRMDPPGAARLREAIRRQRKAVIAYEDATGVRSHRTVWPIALVYFDNVRVLAAWCEQRAAFRHFRLDRLVVEAISADRYPGARHSLVMRWREQDRDWRTMLTVPGVAVR